MYDQSDSSTKRDNFEVVADYVTALHYSILNKKYSKKLLSKFE